MALGNVMGEYNEHAEQSELYERISPESRFVQLANAVLAKFGEFGENEPTAKTATWPQNPADEHYYLRGAMYQNTLHYPTLIYTLDHYTDNTLNSRPTTRYYVSITGPKVSAITIMDGRNVVKKLDDEGRHEATRQLLGILSDVIPKEAREILTTAF